MAGASANESAPVLRQATASLGIGRPRSSEWRGARSTRHIVAPDAAAAIDNYVLGKEGAHRGRKRGERVGRALRLTASTLSSRLEQ
jgi:hypothetical protein